MTDRSLSQDVAILLFLLPTSQTHEPSLLPHATWGSSVVCCLLDPSALLTSTPFSVSSISLVPMDATIPIFEGFASAMRQDRRQRLEEDRLRIFNPLALTYQPIL